MFNNQLQNQSQSVKKHKIDLPPKKQLIFSIICFVVAFSIGIGISRIIVAVNGNGENTENIAKSETAENTPEKVEEGPENQEKTDAELEEELSKKEEDLKKAKAEEEKKTTPAPASGNCTESFGNLMLINPVFTVTTNFVSQRESQLIDLTATYGIRENKSTNGTPRMLPEAAGHLNDMLNAYKAYAKQTTGHDHEMQTRSCFRSRGTSCGRLCFATGTTDHHTGLTCDLIDPVYGTELNTDLYANHPEWQWLKANSYKYGFIDRFPEEWAGSSMSEPVNITEDGSTGLFETWHYRYVGIDAATEIATGKYNNGAYDSLEHYLKATGRINSLTSGKCI